MKVVKAFLIILFSVSLSSCIPEEVLLNGDINGIVTDAETSEPLGAVSIGLDPSPNNSNDLLTGSDGSYQFKNIRPGYYEITASKTKYIAVSRDIEVKSVDLNTNDFALSLAPWPELSVSFLDFGLESTSGSFTIKNVGSGRLNYTCQSALDWIDIAETSGDVTTETDTIHVTIDRSAITEEIQKEFIRVLSFSDVDISDTVHIYANGLIDEDEHYYKIVTIGTQTWMAENLNTGTMRVFLGGNALSDNGEIEKYCYENSKFNCDIYGGLYSWDEIMDYPPHGTEINGTVQGICPDGWHIPSTSEWNDLTNLVDNQFAGNRLKADSPLWSGDTCNITDEFGFGALPGGDMMTLSRIGEERALDFYEKGINAIFWTANNSAESNTASAKIFETNLQGSRNGGFNRDNAASVRCIKDP